MASAALFGLLLCALTFATRILPRCFSPDSAASDSYFHLAYSREIRLAGHRIPPAFSNSVLPHRVTYPFLLHWVMSFLPDSCLLRLERFLPAIIDTLAVGLCWTLLQAMPLPQALLHEVYGLPVLFLTGVCFVLTPGLLRQGLGPRAYQASPRPLGQLFFQLFMLAQIGYAWSADWRWLAVALVASTINTITSIFINQAFVLFSLVFLLFLQPMPLLTTLAGFLLATLFTRGRALTVLRAQFKHSVYYCKTLQRDHCAFLNKSIPAYFREFRNKIFAAFTKQDWADLGGWFCSQKILFHTCLFFFPQIWLLCVLFFMNEAPLHTLWKQWSPVLLWSGSGILLSVLTSWKPLRFLGEPERYLEATVLGPILLFGAVFVQTPPLFWVLAGYSVLCYCLSGWYYVRINRFMERVRRNFLPMLEQFDQTGNVLYHIGTLYQVVFYACRNAKTFSMDNYDSSIFPEKDYALVFGHFPYPQNSIREVAEKYGITHYATTHEYLHRYVAATGDQQFSLDDYEILCDDGEFLIFQARPGRA